MYAYQQPDKLHTCGFVSQIKQVTQYSIMDLTRTNLSSEFDPA